MLGSVKDPSGLAVGAAEIKVVLESTGRTRSAFSNELGDFIVAGLDGGLYTLRVSKQGFKQLERRQITLSAGDRLSVGELALEIGAVSETVSVSSQGVMVQTRSAERAETITPSQVQNLLVRGRNVMDLMQLLPGVVLSGQPENLSLSANFNVLGNRQTTNNITVDGIPATDMGNGSQLKLTVNQDAVAEVKILVSNYQAEYGRMSGSNVIIVTKSGSREFHGLASYFKRHEQFNANNFFNNRTGLPIARYRYNTFTYNVGGPIFIPGKFNRNREKLFFNWGQEFWPIKDSRTGNITVPTDLERRGDYSQTLDVSNRLVVIRDPVSGQPFPSNLIPASRIDPNGLALLKLFPAPNFFDRSVSRGNYNYIFNTGLDLPKYTHSLKIDYNATNKDTFTFGFNKFSDESTGSVGATASNQNWPMYRKTYITTPVGLTGRYTRILSPSLINEFNFGYLTQPADDRIDDDQLKAIQRAGIGFTAGQFSRTGNPQDIIPNASFGAVPSPANISVEGRFPLYNRYYIYNWSNNISWTSGSHTIKGGVYLEYFQRNQKKAVPFNGTFDFGRNVNNPLDTNWAYSNALLGGYSTYTESSDAAWMNVRTTTVEWFLQDNWKVNRKLTLDYGMRFYIVPPLYERDDLIAGFVPSAYDPARRARLIQPGFNPQNQRVGVHPVTGALYPAAQIGAIAPGVGDPANGMVVDATDSTVPRGLMKNRGLQYGPRFGLAYDLTGNGKTAIRAGGGIFYNRFFTEVFFGPFVGQPPIINTPVVNYGQLNQLKSATGLLYPTNVFAADPSGMQSTIYNFSFSIQHDLGWNTVIDVGYAGSLGRHLYWRRDINPVPLGANFNPANFDPTLANRPLPGPFLRPIQGYNDITMVEGAGSSNYHGLLVSAKRRFSGGLEFGAAYTYSKTLDFNDTDTAVISPLVDRRVWNYGLADFDRTHILNINYVWKIPAPASKNPFLNGVLDGWQLSGITSMVSGQPLGIGQSFVNAVDLTGTPSQGSRIVILGNPYLPKSERGFSTNFRTDVFAPTPVGSIGTGAKTNIRGPGINNWDMALFKSFKIRETIRLQFRWELYNAFNHTQFSGLDSTARWDPQGKQVNARFGEFTSARSPRQMQLALRFFF